MERLDGVKWSCIWLKEFGRQTQKNANCENDRQDDQPGFEQTRSRHWVGQNERRCSGTSAVSKFQSHQGCQTCFIREVDVDPPFCTDFSALSAVRLSQKKQAC